VLRRLSVEELAVIASAELELDGGFTVLTGETGAGKSLLVDALGLVLGDRGAQGLVRKGARRASVTAEFDLPDDGDVVRALDARDLPREDGLILHRQIGADGRSRAWANGVPVPLGVLRELGEPLVEIHGQHEHHALARPAYQRDMLDAWAGAGDEAAAVADAARAVQAARARLEQARDSGQGRAARIEFLRFQLQELDELAPREGEYQELHAEYERLRHHERIAEALGIALGALEEGEAPAAGTLAAARQALAQLPGDTGFAETAGLLEQAEALVEEASRRLQQAAEADVDPRRLDGLNERIARYQSLARKHGAEPEGLAAQRDAFAAELDDIDAGGDRLQRLEEEARGHEAQWRRAADALGKKRKAAATRFARAVTRAVRELGMPHASFRVTLDPVETAPCPAAGAERVRFDVATNAGQAAGPLAQVASGGELSRLALAVEVLASATAAPVMVFDEVDAGISGRVAELVGRRLKALSERGQVLCVTHLPQVAALADRHFSVAKAKRGAGTVTEVLTLDRERRVEALAEMLGGVRVTDSARDHARELMARTGA